jgi:hypothetical protein
VAQYLHRLRHAHASHALDHGALALGRGANWFAGRRAKAEDIQLSPTALKCSSFPAAMSLGESQATQKEQLRLFQLAIRGLQDGDRNGAARCKSSCRCDCHTRHPIAPAVPESGLPGFELW